LTRLTDGNLSSHAKRLESAGLVAIEKAFRDGKPVTTFLLTDDGRRRLSEHVDRLLKAVRVIPDPSAISAAAVTDVADEEWVD
jgi:DNA-binding PadR family transcriptional regulator